LSKYFSILFFFIISNHLAIGQIDTKSDIITTDSINNTLDTIPIVSESLDSSTVLKADSSIIKLPVLNSNVKISKDSLADQVVYGSVDSNYMDVVNNQIHLYGEAFVEFQDMKIEAAYLMFDFNTNIAHAFKSVDSLGLYMERPTFTNPDQEFNYKELKFNFKTQKGVVYDAISKEGEFFLHGNKTKFVSKGADSTLIDDQIFNENAIITTCNHEHPHFGIRTSKLKVVPEKLAVLGPSNLEIAGIPTPLFLPFGFFPLLQGRSSGLIFPSEFTYDRDLGLTFRDIGYYFPINQYMDARIIGDIYTNGSYAVRLQSSYKKRYAYTGRLELGYSSIRRESTIDGSDEINTAFSIQLTHRQDAKAHPYRSIDGSINLQSNQYNSRTFNDFDNVFENKIRSNFGFRHSMPGTPFSFSMTLNHSQDNQTRQVSLTFPNINLNMNTIFPFKRKNVGSNGEKWFEKINLKYSGAFKNFVETSDTTLFTEAVFDEMQYGFSHKASTGASFRVAKYFNLTPSINYDELWYFRTLDKEYDDTFLFDTLSIDSIPNSEEVFVRQDTTFGTFTDNIVDGFETFRKFNTNINLSTQIFGTKTFKKGWLRGIRHIIKPTLGFSYAPDTRAKYIREVSVNPNEEFIDPLEFNPYQGGIFSAPLNEESKSFTYGFTNQIEAKYYSKKDSTEKKFKLFNNINVNGNYNFARDSLKWSNVRISGNTTLIKNITNFNFAMTLTPYAKVNNRSIDETIWSRKGRLLAFDNFSATLNTRLSFKKIKDIFSGGGEKKNSEKNSGKGGKSKDKEELGGIFDLLENFTINHVYQASIRRINEVDTFMVTAHSIQIRGRMQLSKNWDFSVGNIAYDIKNNSFVYPSLNFARDLHCWRMNFSWVPARGQYGFFIGAKSNQLSFLKGDYRQNNINQFF